MLFKYILTDSQYQRFQHNTNDAEIRALCEKVGVEVTNEQIVGGKETWYFQGRCNGTMSLVHLLDHWECWIQVRSKPFWLPNFILRRGFQKALQ